MGKLASFYCGAQEWEGDRRAYLSLSISEQNMVQKETGTVLGRGSLETERIN